MPTYEYACKHCGHRFELLQKISAPPLEKCPKCSKKLDRLIGSGSGIIFKGSGFYATDYPKTPKPKSHKHSPHQSCSNCPKSSEGCSA